MAGRTWTRPSSRYDSDTALWKRTFPRTWNRIWTISHLLPAPSPARSPLLQEMYPLEKTGSRRDRPKFDSRQRYASPFLLLLFFATTSNRVWGSHSLPSNAFRRIFLSRVKRPERDSGQSWLYSVDIKSGLGFSSFPNTHSWHFAYAEEPLHLLEVGPCTWWPCGEQNKKLVLSSWQHLCHLLNFT
jgi:hypothetical protein